ncbi:hypothetical protein GCM10009016_32180 [Halomonas beimenensis]
MALLEHVLDHAAAGVEDAVEVGVDDLAPLLRGHLLEGAISGDAGAVDQHTDGTMGVMDLLRPRHAGIVVGEVDAGQRDVVVTIRLLLLEPGLGLLGVVVPSDYLIAGIGQGAADGAPDASGSSGHPGYGSGCCH